MTNIEYQIIKEFRENFKLEKDDFWLECNPNDVISFLFSAMERVRKETARDIEKILYTESGFLREDENLAGDILGAVTKEEKDS